MKNSEITEKIKLYGQLLELHQENAFKAKSYATAAYSLKKVGQPLESMSEEEMVRIPGLGKGIASKIGEIIKTGEFGELDELIKITPAGVIEMLNIKGVGPSKIRVIWKDLGIESTGELLYACRENRLVAAKGFGLKTQDSVEKAIEFMMANASLFHLSKLDSAAGEIRKFLLDAGMDTAITGDLRRKCEILDKIELLAEASLHKDVLKALEGTEMFSDIKSHTDHITAIVENSIPLTIHFSDKGYFAYNLMVTTGNEAHLKQLGLKDKIKAESEEEIYSGLGIHFIEPELREGADEVERAKKGPMPELVTWSDLKGILHNHSTYSDGLNTLEEMAKYCRELGFEYLGISDHSRSAFYAGGLEPERVLKQHEEIDLLNKKMAPFRIFKGIESDILFDGSLDYEPEILEKFDFVVASIHSVLKMTEEKATERLIKAIENPHTTILGHPTGRLLLMREGYPINHKKVIDACAANGVVIEINSNPYRLDLDWRWIGYALEKGIPLSINPDAHKKEGYHDMHYGVAVGRKGGLTPEMTFNALSAKELELHFSRKKSGEKPF